MSSLHFLIFCESALVEALQNNALSACDRKHTGVMDATILRRRQQYKRGEEEGCSSGYMRLCLHLQELLVGLAAMRSCVCLQIKIFRFTHCKVGFGLTTNCIR